MGSAISSGTIVVTMGDELDEVCGHSGCNVGIPPEEQKRWGQSKSGNLDRTNTHI